MAEEKEFKTLTQIVSTEGDEKNRNITPVNPSSGFLEELILTKEVDGKIISFKLMPWKKESTNQTVDTPYLSMNISESMMNGCMHGSLVFKDYRNWADEFAFTGKEQIKVKIKIPGHGKTEDKIVNFKFLQEKTKI